MTRETPEQRKARTRAAVEAHKRNAVIRAVEDPQALGRAARIIRMALERNKLSLADLTGDEQKAS